MEYELIRSDRRTLGLEVKRDGSVIVRAPRRLPQREIDRFLADRAEWLRDAQARQRSRAEARPEPTEAEKKSFNPMSNSSLDSTGLEELGWKGLFDAPEGFAETVEVLREIL